MLPTRIQEAVISEWCRTDYALYLWLQDRLY